MYFGKTAISTLCLFNFVSFAVADKLLRNRKLGPSNGPPDNGPHGNRPHSNKDEEDDPRRPGGPNLDFGQEADYIVVFKDESSHSSFSQNEMATVNSVRHLSFMNGEVIKLPNAQAAQQWAERDDVLFVEKDQEVRKLAETVPYGINLVEAFNIDYVADSGVKACIIDTGYALLHEDLPNNINYGNDNLVTGYNPYDNGEVWYKDGDGHGTHVAGTMAAVGGNDVGVVGVTSKAKMPLHIGKGLTDSGSGSMSGVLDAMKNCVENGAKVVNMSLGGGGPSSAVQSFLTGLENDGTNVLFVAAAGNGGSSSYSYPASYDSPLVMSVAAVNSNSVKASFSQYNDQVDIAAPGVGVKSTVTTSSGASFSYATWGGTSMASPHVAGVAALIWSHHPSKSAAEVRSALECSAVMPEQYGNNVKNDFVGYGVVNAQNALALLEWGDFSGCPSSAPTMSPTPLDCSEDVIEIRITTDLYPTETAWFLTDICSNTEVAEKLLGDYTLSNYEYITLICVPPGREYSFKITDEFGDGICCNFGDGSYDILYNGEPVASGSGTFAAEEIKTFGQCGTSPPSPAPSLAPQSSIGPTSSHSPTYSPAPTVTSSPSSTSSCSSGQVEFIFTLTTDNYPEETKWILKEAFKWQTGTKIAGESFGTYNSSQTTYIETICIKKNKSHIFRINDKANDGLCCDHGNGEYSIALNGQEPFHSGGNFGKKEQVKFMAFPDYSDMQAFTIEIEREPKGVYLDWTSKDEEENS
uniref:subtilisin n=1 Tax=Ditylum brightwellii TaxID=49249 RepID=A0A7S4SJ16_9STRA